jgi:hypothetical protein
MVIAASALGSVIEWVGCAHVPGVVTAAIVVGPNPLRAMGIAVATAYLAQLVTTDAALGSPDAAGTRTLRVLWCPAATTAFGLGGLVGLTQLVRGGSGVGKTERR